MYALQEMNSENLKKRKDISVVSLMAGKQSFPRFCVDKLPQNVMPFEKNQLNNPGLVTERTWLS